MPLRAQDAPQGPNANQDPAEEARAKTHEGQNQFGESFYTKKMRLSVYSNAIEYNQNYLPTDEIGVINLKNIDRGADP